jgi:hypothetical protein
LRNGAGGPSFDPEQLFENLNKLERKQVGWLPDGVLPQLEARAV